MPRTKIVTRQQAQSEMVVREEKVRLALIKMDLALEKIDEIATKYKEAVDIQIQLIRDNTDKQLLQLKWSDFMGLKIQHFAEQPLAVHGPPASRSVSVSRQRGRARSPVRTRSQAQSVDRARRNEVPSKTLLRWPRAGEQMLSKVGTPLAMNFDQNTLKQVKTLNTNLGVIVDMATKMGKL